jgi:hypothetical protein
LKFTIKRSLDQIPQVVVVSHREKQNHSMLSFLLLARSRTGFGKRLSAKKRMFIRRQDGSRFHCAHLCSLLPTVDCSLGFAVGGSCDTSFKLVAAVRGQDKPFLLALSL